MKYPLLIRKALFSALLPLFALITLVIGCKNLPQNQATNAQAEPSPTVEQTKPTNAAETPRFAVAEVCGLTEKLGQRSPYSALIGRKWIKDGKGDGEWDYGCGFNQDVKFVDDGNASISSDYSAIGGKDDVKYITVEYTANNFTLSEAKELAYRKEYLGFLNRLSKHLYGVELPSIAQEQILGKKDLNKANTGLQVGTGWINISFNGPAPKVVSIDVHFHESKEAYDKYKDQ